MPKLFSAVVEHLTYRVGGYEYESHSGYSVSRTFTSRLQIYKWGKGGRAEESSFLRHLK